MPAEPVTTVTTTLLSRRQLMERLGMGKSTVIRYSEAGFMPRPVRLGNLLRWRSDEIEAWLNDGCPREPLPGR